MSARSIRANKNRTVLKNVLYTKTAAEDIMDIIFSEFIACAEENERRELMTFLQTGTQLDR